jgi:hypothetical protein
LIRTLGALVVILPLLISTISCSSTVAFQDDPRSSIAASQRKECKSFGIADLGEFWTARFSGRVLLDDSPFATSAGVPLPGVEISATNQKSGKTVFVVAAADGSYDLDLKPGLYEVRTCQEGFDELRFELTVDPSAEGNRVDLFVGISEGGGRRDVEVYSKSDESPRRPALDVDETGWRVFANQGRRKQKFHVFLDGLHRVEVVLCGHRCGSPFRLQAYRLR